MDDIEELLANLSKTNPQNQSTELNTPLPEQKQLIAFDPDIPFLVEQLIEHHSKLCQILKNSGKEALVADLSLEFAQYCLNLELHQIAKPQIFVSVLTWFKLQGLEIHKDLDGSIELMKKLLNGNENPLYIYILKNCLNRLGLVQQSNELWSEFIGLQEISQSKSTSISQKSKDEGYSFTVVKVDDTGKEAERYTQQAELYTEDLGNGIILEMVKLPSDIYMGRYPVTQGQYKAVMKFNPSTFRYGKDYPVESVTWENAQEFCSELSILTGKSYRLPTQDEWEEACRGGTITTYHFGNVLPTHLVNFDKNKISRTTSVGWYGVANDFGLYDMHGNVWELCSNINANACYRCGGGWNSGIGDCASDNRSSITIDSKSNILGFRLVLEI